MDKFGKRKSWALVANSDLDDIIYNLFLHLPV